MPTVWEMVSIVFLGLFAMGSIDSLGSSAKDIGVYGTSTGGAAEIFFFLTVAAVVFVALRNYIGK